MPCPHLQHKWFQEGDDWHGLGAPGVVEGGESPAVGQQHVGTGLDQELGLRGEGREGREGSDTDKQIGEGKSRLWGCWYIYISIRVGAQQTDLTAARLPSVAATCRGVLASLTGGGEAGCRSGRKEGGSGRKEGAQQVVQSMCCAPAPLLTTWVGRDRRQPAGNAPVWPSLRPQCCQSAREPQHRRRRGCRAGKRKEDTGAGC